VTRYTLIKYDLLSDGEGWCVNDLWRTGIKLDADGLTERALLGFLRDNFDLDLFAARYCPPGTEAPEMTVDDYAIHENDSPIGGEDGEDDDEMHVSFDGVPLCKLQREGADV